MRPTSAAGAHEIERSPYHEKISSLLKPEAIAIGAAASSKDDAISKLVDLMTTQGNVADRDAYEAAVHAR